MKTVKKFLLADPAFGLFKLSGTAKTSFGYTLQGTALQMAYSARDRSPIREEGIRNEKCDLWFMQAIPTEANLPKGELRAYVVVKPARAKTYAGLYFVERMLAKNQAFIDPVPFHENSNPETLITALFSSAESKHTGQKLNDLTLRQLAIITHHTGYTHEEGLIETIERHFRTSLNGEAMITVQQPPKSWEE